MLSFVIKIYRRFFKRKWKPQPDKTVRESHKHINNYRCFAIPVPKIPETPKLPKPKRKSNAQKKS